MRLLNWYNIGLLIDLLCLLCLIELLIQRMSLLLLLLGLRNLLIDYLIQLLNLMLWCLLMHKNSLLLLHLSLIRLLINNQRLLLLILRLTWLYYNLSRMLLLLLYWILWLSLDIRNLIRLIWIYLALESNGSLLRLHVVYNNFRWFVIVCNLFGFLNLSILISVIFNLKWLNLRILNLRS